MSAEKHLYTNRLVSEKSPYLLQHAHNPVDWYPWGPEAFEKAAREDKPIFLSIGYSTCHWCHVMEHESFEDPEVARLMNETFISIKVDREERPDIDGVYMNVCQMMTGSGGWPLTILMTSDKKPFFAGTYFPKESRFGRPGLVELIPRIREAWKNKRGEIADSARSIAEEVQRTSAPSGGSRLDEAILKSAFTQLSQSFDPRYGGFGRAPKFPTPHHFTFLLRYWKRSGDPEALRMVEETLQAMRRGGIYDQIGFGFHRYSTDERWFLPHFEKMLYDQALLADAYLETYQATGNRSYGETAEEIFTYVLRDMTSPEGAFYSAEDADSEGEEGKFYVWRDDELEKLLTKDEAGLIRRVFNVAPEGNWEGEAGRASDGSNILYLSRSPADLAVELGIPETALRERLETARVKLFKARAKRVHPHKDDKILTDWNGLMIAALAKGSQALHKPEYAKAASRAADFILEKMSDPAGRLFHRYRDGEVAVKAFLDDYSFFIWGLIELYEATFETRYLEQALDLNRTLLEDFWDEAGGLYFTAKGAESLLVRQKDLYDGALPSGNSVEFWNLLRLARITGDTDLEEKASKLEQAFSGRVGQFASAFTQMMVGVDFAVGPSQEIVVVGHTGAADTERMLDTLQTSFLPNKVLLFRPSGSKPPVITRIAPFTEPLTSQKGQATAYVCYQYSCQFPTTDPQKALNLAEHPDLPKKN